MHERLKPKTEIHFPFQLDAQTIIYCQEIHNDKGTKQIWAFAIKHNGCLLILTVGSSPWVSIHITLLNMANQHCLKSWMAMITTKVIVKKSTDYWNRTDIINRRSVSQEIYTLFTQFLQSVLKFSRDRHFCHKIIILWLFEPQFYLWMVSHSEPPVSLCISKHTACPGKLCFCSVKKVL